MKTYFILSVVGKDRPGIVADVSEVIYECGGNIEDSSMSLLRNHFALLLLFSTEREEVNQKLSVSLKRLEGERNLTVFHSPITLQEAHPRDKEEVDRFKITTSESTMPGLSIRSVAFCLIEGLTSLIWRPAGCFLRRAERLFSRWISISRFPAPFPKRI
jgi:predicted amino acid-binding ACT domain protein